MATRQWSPTQVTRISTRPSAQSTPRKEPRDEQARIYRPQPAKDGTVATTTITGIKKKPPASVNTALAQTTRSQPYRMEPVKMRDPEIVDHASNERQRQRSTAGRSVASEMSFGILDYYIHDSPPGPPSHLASEAMKGFDFGLSRQQQPRSQRPNIASQRLPYHDQQAAAGAHQVEVEEDEMELIPLSPRPIVEKDEVVQPLQREPPPLPTSKPPAAPSYTLFPPMRPTTRPPPLLPSANIISPPTPTAITPTNATRPRRSSSIVIPLRRIFSSSSTATTSTITASKAGNRRSSTVSSSTASPPPSASAQSGKQIQRKPLLSGSYYQGGSRWSEDTVISPTTAAALRRTSWGAGAVGAYPDCFFEDDDAVDEGQPLWRRRSRRNGKGMGWLWLVGCCGRG